MQIKKNQLRKLRFGGILAGLFLISILVLASAPKIVSLAESKIASSNLPQQNTEIIPGNIAGIDAKPTVEVVSSQIVVPSVSAKGVYILDLDLNKVLFEKNSHSRLSPASTTKIMTALISMEQYKAADVLVVPQGALVGGSTMGLSVGENMTFRSLLYGMLLNSGNDAAYTLALNYPGGFSAFIERMNLKALSLGLKNTHFENPAGFDSTNNYSSAFDLSVVTKEAIKNTQLSKVFSTKETSVISYDKAQSHQLKNLNKLLSEEKGVIGIKTGFTEKSGENLVTLVDRDGHRILLVMLNSSDRFGETKKLIDWVYNNFKWEVH